LGLPEVEARARHRDRELDALTDRKRLAVDGAALLERLLGAPDAALAVDDHRDVVVAARDPAHRAQLAQRQREVARGVCRDRERLAHDADAARVPHGGLRVLVRQLRVVVDRPRGHRHMARDALGVLGAQRLELIASRGHEVLRRDVFRQLGIRDVVAMRRVRTLLVPALVATVEPAVVPPTGVATLTAVAAAIVIAGSAEAALATVAAAVVPSPGVTALATVATAAVVAGCAEAAIATIVSRTAVA